MITGKTILVTGAGGSIGSALCREILLDSPARLVALDNSELALYNLDRELKGITPVLGDVSIETDVNAMFYKHRIDVVFHAAAYKHVTMCENNSAAAWRVNAYGTKLMARAAHEYNVPKFVLISTDKAVRPTCVMGQTKEAAEKTVREYGYTVVRLGNVVGSSGSVIPLWKEQIARGLPVTITDPDATRYFITPTDAALGILEAAELQPGTYVPEMGKPKGIWEIAASYGAKGFTKIGLRRGEKLHEELFVGERGCTSIRGIWEDAA